MALTKNQIIESLQERLGFTKAASAEAVDTLLEIMKQTMENGDDLLVTGFGKFCIRDKGPRRGRNPATGEDMILPARRVVTFKCSGKLRDRINGNKSG